MAASEVNKSRFVDGILLRLRESATDNSVSIGVGRGIRREKWLREQLRGPLRHVLLLVLVNRQTVRPG